MCQDFSFIHSLIASNPCGYHMVLKHRYPDIYAKVTSGYGKSFSEKLYRFINPTVAPRCKHCGSDRVAFLEITTGFRDYCSNRCAQQSVEITKKREEAFLMNYGVSHPQKVTKVSDKRKATCRARYGGASPFCSSQTRTKAKETCKERYGVENASQNTSIRAKQKATMLERFGVEHPHQSPDVIEKVMKSRYKLKEFVFPSGNKALVQGYEPNALRHLLQEGIGETEIVTAKTDMPAIWYVDDGKRRRYFPDIFIPARNLVVEVKSDYTYTADEGKNLLKKEACEAAGYDFRFMIYNKKGERL